MPIKCKICNAEFSSLISSTHLKRHSVTSAEYKTLYGNNSLASTEYRDTRSQKYLGENNPNFGNKMTTESRKRISDKNSGNVPWNKGTVLEDTAKYKEGSKKREEKYTSGELTRFIPAPTSETRTKISDGMKEYAKTHPVEMKVRAAKSVKTLIDKGYFILKKENTIRKFEEKCVSLGFTIKNRTVSTLEMECNTCLTAHRRSIDSAIHSRMCPACNNAGHSSYEKEVYDYIRGLLPNVDIIMGDKTIMPPLEIDIYIPNKNIAFEIDGVYWHSEEAGKGKFYHKYKTDACKKQSIQLIHIFEDEWLFKNEICKNRIRSKLGISDKIYGRKCHVKGIEWQEAKEFLLKNHIQGQGAGATVLCSGLFHNEQLVAVMTISKLSIAKGSIHKEGNYELNRYASIGNVIGGASKLFNYSINTLMPSSITTYADLRWNTGIMYEKLGFAHKGDTLPGYWYVKGVERIHRFKLRKLDTDPKGITEQDLRRSQGYLRIWDCGNSKWVWTPKSQ